MLKLSKYILILLMFCASCNQSNIIPEKDMVSILVKIQLIDASVQNLGLSKTYFNKDTIDYYSRTINSYGYTKVQFDSSLSFYSKRPKELDAIYDRVIIELSKIETKITTENMMHEDSVAKNTLRNLWNLSASYELPKDGPQATVDFMIPVKGLGIYTISVDVFVHADDESVNPSLVAYFYFDDKSKEGRKSGFTTRTYKRMENPQNYTIQMDLQNSLVTHLKGSLLNHSNAGNDFIKHATLSNIKVYYKQGKSKKFRPIRRGMRLEHQEEKVY